MLLVCFLAKYTVDMDNISSCRERVEEAADEDLSLRDVDYLGRDWLDRYLRFQRTIIE
jgi:hypothetical protein